VELFELPATPINLSSDLVIK